MRGDEYHGDEYPRGDNRSPGYPYSPEQELILVLIRLVEAWHYDLLSWNGPDPEELLDLIARAEAAFDRQESGDEDDDPRIGGE